ncbi:MULTISPECIES: hypothetical protein [unclassified Bradyrhizobium]|uniref:hypothetical protein n=1 Tax=unclassified Bradyrhizobium TaxID=2631580 RepID=UPI0024796835|nr:MULTISPECIES: hypothetical protein [unclassified Bradyrhizobium]WGR74359.1 hypothetical protein MTX24_16675 [Bradyrhizobium sp. ISRA426]WGR79194.1 hypothetical protein MTX21_01790 [Bradyrhizobium sp. ISRA430]WGR90615.1 hypothetical protein MTX25_39600 [Bradyrhizobium sp. ISRA432]
MSDERIPAEVFPLAEFLGEEMIERGWNTDDLAIRIGGNENMIARNMLALMLLLSVQREGLLIGDSMLDSLTEAFEVDPQFFRNLDTAWREAPADRRRFYSPPEKLFGPVSRRSLIRAI